MKRTFLILLLTVFLELGVSCGGGANPVWKPDSSIPIAGPNIQGTADLDQAITGLMKTYNLPGVALAITKDGHLILARAYGYADLEARQQMQPDSLGRIGSIGKTITAVATLHLVEQGKLNLDTPFLDILTQYSLPPNADPRLRTVTVRQIMWHAGGWDTAIGGDPEMESTQIAKALGVPEPTNCGDWIQYMLGKPLDFAPGTKYSYSNFGYCILGRVVEKVSGKKYADYLAQDVLPQMDIHDMQIGHTLESQRLLREVKYYDFPGASRIPSVLPPHDLTPAPYGWAYIEALEGMGGWIGSPIDLMRFINHVDGTQPPQYLGPAMVSEFTARPSIPGAENWTSWYGLGIGVDQQAGGLHWNHDGGCPGTMALLNRRPDGYDWALVTNSRPLDNTPAFGALQNAVDRVLDKGFAGSPTDLYGNFPSQP